MPEAIVGMYIIWYSMPPEVQRKIPAVFYRTRGGAELVRNWLRGLDERDRNAIGLDLMRVQFRWPVGMPLCRAMGDGLWDPRHAAKWSHRAGVVLRDSRPRRRSARLHQEDTKDAR